MPKFIKVFSIILLILLLSFFLYYFFVAKAPRQEKIKWGVNFSQMQAEALKLDWKKTYLAILEDLGAKEIKLLTQWDWMEGQKDRFYFKDIDWQIKQAELNKAKVIYVVGMKSGRWPECHLPQWAKVLSKKEQQEELLKYIREVILRYKNSPAIIAWQVENEPLFRYGECPWHDKKFLKKEVEFIKSLDSSRKIIISDSGEQSLWTEAGKLGDIVGTTMYRRIWFGIAGKLGFYGTFPIPAVFYWYKSQIIKYLFNKEVINVELQAEPWGPKLIFDLSLPEQEKTMNLGQFRKNVEYARQSGLDTFYFWGTEWWYWLKEKHNRPEIWNEARKLFKESNF